MSIFDLYFVGVGDEYVNIIGAFCVDPIQWPKLGTFLKHIVVKEWENGAMKPIQRAGQIRPVAFVMLRQVIVSKQMWHHFLIVAKS